MLRTSSEADEHLLLRSEVQKAVRALGDFARVAVRPEYVCVSRRISSAKDLDAAVVKDLVARTLDLARFCR